MKLFDNISAEKLFKTIPFTQVCMAIHKEKAKEYCRDDKFDWHTELVNAGILFGLAFFITLGATNNYELGATIGTIQGLIAFFTRLAIKRGIYAK